MDIRICQCDLGGTVNVQGPEWGRTFGRGAEVDFEAAVAPGVRVTWGQALARYAHLFEAPKSADVPKSVRREKPAPAGAPDGEDKA